MLDKLLRRKFLSTFAFGGAALAFDPVRRAWLTSSVTDHSMAPLATAPVPHLDGDLRAAGRRGALSPLPPLDGELSSDAAALRAAADDYGHIVQQMPIAVLSPGSIDDIQKMVVYANEHRLALSVRGAGHSALGQTQTAGVVIDMSRLTGVEHIDKGACVVAAGTTWIDVVASGLAVGAIPPVLPLDLYHTVGGVLALGGVSAASHHAGLVADNVTRLEVITGGGERVVCSEHENHDLFAAVLAGTALHAVIVKATLRMTEFRGQVRTHESVFDDASAFLASMLANAREGSFHELSGSITPGLADRWIYTLEGSVFADELADLDSDRGRSSSGRGRELKTYVQDKDHTAWLTRFLGVQEHLIRSDLWESEHPVLNVIVPIDAAKAFLERALPLISPDDLCNLPITMSPLVRERVRSKEFPLPDSDVSLAITFQMFPQGAASELERIRSTHESLFELVRASGGTAFGGGSLELSTAQIVAQRGGAALTRLQARRQLYDPNGVLLAANTSAER
ncbi:MAG: FAD-binding protein [Byssovorax sp.]